MEEIVQETLTERNKGVTMDISRSESCPAAAKKKTQVYCGGTAAG